MESCLLNVQWQFYWGHKLGSMVPEHHLAYGYVGIGLKMYVCTFTLCIYCYTPKYVVKRKSAKLFMMYAVGKLEAALNISHLIFSTSSQRVS